MKKLRLTAAILCLGFLVAFSCNSPFAPAGIANPTASAAKPTTNLTDSLPYDVSIDDPNTDMAVGIRRDFDLFSWRTFIAISWPVNKDQLIGENGDNATIWESWKENYQVFLQDGSKPLPWDPIEQSKQKILVQVGKTPTVLTDVTQPFLTGPLIDQNGAYTRFQIVMNKEMFDFIDTNTLYNYQGQMNFPNTISFPVGDGEAKTHGAIMVKASWKIMGKGDDVRRFHTAKATIHVPAIPARHIRDTSFQALVGLVGLHIGTKTANCPQWIWSTFEQVDNAPTFTQSNAGHHSFYNAAASNAKINNQPDLPWDPNRPGQTPSQIVRLTPIFTGTQALNDSFHQQLIAINPKNVWQFYELVGTQWPTDRTKMPMGDPFPVYLANSTLESYIQGIIRDKKVVYVPGVSSSCIGCHNGATTLGGKASDFTYLLRTAFALPKSVPSKK